MKKCSICGCEVNDKFHIVLNAGNKLKEENTDALWPDFRKQIRIIRMDFIMMTV